MRRRPPLWLAVALLLVVLGVGVYGSFAGSLPFGLSGLVRAPGGSAFTPAPAPARAPAGQPLVLGALSVAVQGVQRQQDTGESGGRGSPGAFTVVLVEFQNGGSEPVTLQRGDFRLVDDRGRGYAVDLEATRTAVGAARRRLPFDASVPPGGRLATALAFETAPDAGSLSLRVSLGYGEVELPR